MKIPNWLKYSLSLILGLALCYVAFRKVELEEFIQKVSEVNYWWVWLSILISLVSHWLRAYRWNLMLKPLGYKVTESKTFMAVMIGYMANLAFPRLGEVTRCGVLKRNNGVPMSIGFGSVVTERIFDFIILASLIILDFIVEFDKVYTFFMQNMQLERFGGATMIFSILGVAVVAGIITAIWFFRAMGRTNFSNPVLNRIRTFILDMKDGLTSVKKVENLTGFLLSTVGIWIAYFLMSYVIFFAVEETATLSLGAGLSILAAAGVAMIVPVQGGIGAYHYLVSGVLVFYGIENTIGLFFATLLHMSQVVLYLIVGSLCVTVQMVFVKKFKIPKDANLD